MVCSANSGSVIWTGLKFFWNFGIFNVTLASQELWQELKSEAKFLTYEKLAFVHM